MVSFREQMCEWCKKERRWNYALIKKENAETETYYFCNKQHLINFLIGKKLPQQIIERIKIEMKKEDIRKVIFSKEVIDALAQILEAKLKMR
jgi:hypothetical protein